MPRRQIRTIYLAGPITGCNEEQKKVWRDRIRRSCLGDFNFYCPVERLEALRERGVRITPYQVVNLDMKAIRESDAVIANMWKESIGTAIGVALAAFNGKPVVIIDKNMLNSHTLNFYAYAVVRDEDEAIQRLKEYFRTVDKIQTVQKSKGKPDEQFRIDKLVVSIRNACYAAGQNEFLATAEIVPEVLAKLATLETAAEGSVKTSAIKNAVFEVLAGLENDEEKGENFQRIRQAWDQFNKKEPLTEFVPPIGTSVRVFSEPQMVPFPLSGKAHKLLWGKLRIRKADDIPTSARDLFREICRVDGITEIRFGGFGDPPHHGSCKVDISAHMNPLQIKGVCYDEGKYGGRQTFKIRVRDPSLRDPVLNTLREHLGSLSLLNRPEKPV
jgi:nucleoside 2-deoxyribosyltransferase